MILTDRLLTSFISVLLLGINYNKVIAERSRKVYNYWMDKVKLKPPEDICEVREESPGDINILIRSSYVNDLHWRLKCRKQMSLANQQAINIKQIFVLASLPSTNNYSRYGELTQKDIELESSTYNDILQGDFLDTSRNLTHKHLLGLRWVTKFCRRARFLLKIDDFVDVDLGTFQELSHYFYLANRKHFNRSNVLRGFIKENEPNRNKSLSYYVTREEYPGNKYPLYVWGSYYITTPETAELFCEEAKYHPYFYVDDVFITGILREILHIEIKSIFSLVDRYDDYDYEEYKSGEDIQAP